MESSNVVIRTDFQTRNDGIPDKLLALGLAPVLEAGEDYTSSTLPFGMGA
jgi:hypothetical protein